MKNLVSRTITGIIFVAAIVVSLVFYAQCPFVFYFLFLFFTGVGSFELVRMAKKINIHAHVLLTVLLSLAVFSLPFLGTVVFHLQEPVISAIRVILISCFGILIFVAEIFRRRPNPLSNIAVSLLPAGWVALPFALIGQMLADGSPAIPLSLFIIIWVNDTLAYCAGSLFGNHRLCERISPKKSVEGFVTAWILTAGLSTGFCFIPYFHDEILSSPIRRMVFATLVIMAGTCGDLAESLFKRNCGVKDSGKILPGHGGILDRFDSSFLAIPAAECYLLLLSVTG